MEEISLKYKGQVSSYNKKGHFGFIETEDKSSYFFFFDEAEQLQLKKMRILKEVHSFFSGDEVEFELRPSTRHVDKMEAFNITFIRNVRIQNIIDEAVAKGKLLGYLKQVKDEFFVKHVGTYMIIPVQTSSWETNFHSVYSNNLNKVVEFKLLQTAQTDKLVAVLIERRFSEEYNKLIELFESRKPTEARITGRNSHGFFATILNDRLNAFIHSKKGSAESQLSQIRKGDLIEVTIRRIPKNQTQIPISPVF